MNFAEMTRKHPPRRQQPRGRQRLRQRGRLASDALAAVAERVRHGGADRRPERIHRRRNHQRQGVHDRLPDGAGFSPDPAWKERTPSTDKYAVEGLVYLP